MPNYEECLREVEQATERLDSVDALDQAAVQDALDARSAAIEQLSAALGATPREQLAEGLDRRLRAVLGKGNCALMRLAGARQRLAIELAHSQHAQHTAQAMRAALAPQSSLCQWVG